jgi:hypothetical protein
MTGWNLPPGCTPRDIDRAMGAYSRCEECGREMEVDEDNEEQICARCAYPRDEEDDE